VVARQVRLRHRGLAVREEAGQEDGALHLSARHLQVVARAAQRRAPHDDRGHAVATARQDLGSHAAERVDDAPHRALAQRRIAGEDREPRHRGEHPGEEP
jgi:hypothetical protein